MKEIVVVAGKRTPMGEYCGPLREHSALELGAIAAKAAIEQSRFEPREFDHAIFGNALQTSGDAVYGARHVALKAGLPVEVPALTVNRLCGSGIQSIISAAQMIELGEANVVLAGGMESMSQAPHVIRGARWGLRLGQGRLEDSLMVALLDTYCGCNMAATAENLARKYGITREAQDEFALRSQQLAAAAWDAGRFRDEITPAGEVERDDHMRPDTTLEGLAKLKTAFSKDGFVTAGNASGIVDGAAAVVVTTAERAKTQPLGRIVSWGIAGVPPEIMGIGPVPAVKIALEKAGLALSGIDLVEINEAFAAQYLSVEKALELDREKVNVNGGAIALGHPLGATGTRITMTVLYELKRRKKRYGLAAACIGGGQGIAIIVEAV
ncbi:MAG: acetyl-CoA C-acetyltransferase [Acidobacteria bacterium]|nr:acetyl-CoA C-acetyltransferase [Acidobacteriota bacterium]